MKGKIFLQSKKSLIFALILGDLFLFILLFLFHSPILLILLFFFFLLTGQITLFVFNYYQRKNFYQEFLTQLEELDQKYLISELLSRPSFLEGAILYDSIYEITKSMREHLNQYQHQMDDYKTYLELWIHEIKIPLSNMILHLHNQEKYVDPFLLEQTKKLEDYMDQVLYYSRAEYAEVDYFIKECSLEKVLQNVILHNKDSFFYHKVKIHTESLSYFVLTDAKWLAFILNQILSNSIKYEAQNIVISAVQENGKTILKIKDDGIGILKSDLPKVFEKSFTGNNGRNSSRSTGMGLYICSQLCKKLGHTIQVFSEEKKFTEVQITFFEPDFYETVR